MDRKIPPLLPWPGFSLHMYRMFPGYCKNGGWSFGIPKLFVLGHGNQLGHLPVILHLGFSGWRLSHYTHPR